MWGPDVHKMLKIVLCLSLCIAVVAMQAGISASVSDDGIAALGTLATVCIGTAVGINAKQRRKNKRAAKKADKEALRNAALQDSQRKSAEREVTQD